MSKITFQRRHFQFIADIIHGATLSNADRKSLAIYACHALASTNPHFNRGRFIDACIYERTLDEVARDHQTASAPADGVSHD